MAIVWRIVSVCCSSWRSTISAMKPSPAPLAEIVSIAASRTAPRYSRAACTPSSSTSPRTDRGVSKASYRAARSGRKSARPQRRWQIQRSS